MFKIEKATRLKSKLRIGMFGPSGAGKTYSSLLMAKGLCGDWEKVIVIDTERRSAGLYEHLGPYNTLPFDPPYTPERYIDAIKVCEQAGMEVIVIDSISHEWDGPGGIIEISNNMPGNSFTNWSKLTPRHNKFIDTILQSSAHVICCGRAKQDYVLSENERGKQVPTKVGLKAVTRDGFDYEMTLAFDLDIKHNAESAKDRTGLFADKPAFKITEQTGEQLAEWVSSGKEPVGPASPWVAKILALQKEHHLTNESIKQIGKFETLKGLSDEQYQEIYDSIHFVVSEAEVSAN